MNVQDVIEKALAGNDGIPVTPVEHSSCEDVQVEKLASALNFIGANLETSVEELEKLAKDDNRRDKAVGAGALVSGLGAAGAAGHKARGLHKDLAHNLSEQASYAEASLLSPKQQETAYLGEMKEKAKKLKNKRNLYAGGAGLGLLATGYGVKKLYDSRKKNQQKKTASVDEALYHAAQAGKQALLESSIHELEKLAKDHDKSGAPSKREKIIAGTALGGGGLAALGGGYAAREYHKGLKAFPEARRAMVEAEKLMESGQMFDQARKTLNDAEPIMKSRRNRSLGIAGLGAVAAAYGGKKLYDAHKRKQQKKTASVDEALYHAAQAGKQALLEKNASEAFGDIAMYGSTLAGGVGAHKARKRMRAAGISEEEINDLVTKSGGAARGAGASLFGGSLGMLAANSGLGKKMGITPGGVGEGMAMAVPAALGGLSAYKSQTNRADRAIKRHKARQKTAAFQKVAEDRINPAKISAGPADPYSGEIMPNPGQVSNEFVGNTRDHHALIALKAQKVRARINKDMKQYVTNVGDGYNLQGHLSKMNK